MTAHASSFLTCAASKSPFHLSSLGVISGVFRLCKRRNFTSGKWLPERTTVRYCHVSGYAISWSTSPFNCHKSLSYVHCSKELQKRTCLRKFSLHYITRTRKRQNYHSFQKTSSKTPFTYCGNFRVFTSCFLKSFLNL